MSVDYNGVYWSVTGPSGDTWTFDESDRDVDYIDNAISVWTEWREFVVADMLRGQL